MDSDSSPPLFGEMDSTSIPSLSKSDPASVDALIIGAGPPAIADHPMTQPPLEPATQPPGGMDAPEKDEETIMTTLTSPLPPPPPLPQLPSEVMDVHSDLYENNPMQSLKRARDDNITESLLWDFKKMRRSARTQLTSLDEDPEEKTAPTDIKDLNWRWPAYDQMYDQLGNVRFIKRGKAPKQNSKGFPFQVVHRSARDCALWPDFVLIKLKSSLLTAILSKYLPDDKELQYLDTVDLNGRQVYSILDKLKQHQLQRNDPNPNPSPGSEGVLSTETGSVSQIDHNGASNGASKGVSNRNPNFPDKSSEIHSQDLVPLPHSATGETGEEARLHLHHLVRFLEEEYRVVAVRQQHMKEDKSVSFDMLWAFLPPGTTVVYQCSYTQEQLCAKVLENAYRETQCGKIFTITLAIWDYNGVVYRQCSDTRVIGEFSGEKLFDTLAVRPIDMVRGVSAESLHAEFLAKGRRFQELAMRTNNCFMHYDGTTYRIRQNEILKEKADGRVMIDLRSFAVMNPNHPMRTAQPPVSSAVNDPDRDVKMLAHQGHVAQNMATRRAHFRRPKPGSYITDEAFQALAESSQEVDDENLVFAPAIVYGFSFTLKQWGAFSVTGFSEIDFHVNAFDALVMDPDLKGLVYSLVSQFIATKSIASGPASSVEDLPSVDPIADKGEGCIFLCYGPPGTGKTLTAESIAENLRRPLWSLSVAELGTTPAGLEKTLLKVLEIAAMWKAVLLLDEADVYLEKRVASTDLTRNAMTGVFLRLLEYYRGVLFLTTNRITTFDDAFRSRISLMMSYPKLDQERREQIWRATLTRAHAGEGVKVGPEFLAEMARHPINGREIRSAIHIAQTLARSKNEELQEQHLRVVMGVVTKTTDTLDAALRDT